MTTHRADCADCPWSFEDEDLIEVSDELERHSQKEHHHVDLERAVATDGGVPAARYRHQCVDAVRTHAGVGDQDNTCVNDTPGCPGPDAGSGELPCSACFLRGGEADA